MYVDCYACRSSTKALEPEAGAMHQVALPKSGAAAGVEPAPAPGQAITSAPTP